MVFALRRLRAIEEIQDCHLIQQGTTARDGTRPGTRQVCMGKSAERRREEVAGRSYQGANRFVRTPVTKNCQLATYTTGNRCPPVLGNPSWKSRILLSAKREGSVPGLSPQPVDGQLPSLHTCTQVSPLYKDTSYFILT